MEALRRCEPSRQQSIDVQWIEVVHRPAGFETLIAMPAFRGPKGLRIVGGRRLNNARDVYRTNRYSDWRA